MPWQRASRSVLLVIEAVGRGCACVASFLRITWAATRNTDVLRSITQQKSVGLPVVLAVSNSEDEMLIVASEQCRA